MHYTRLLTFLTLAVFLLGLTACGPSRDRDRRDRPTLIDADAGYDTGPNIQPDAGPITDSGNPTNPDATVSPDVDEPPPTPTCQGCTDTQVCVSGECVEVPNNCPCPSETYCNLADNTCIVGCIADGDCATGRICNSDQRQCRDGCREDSACGTGRICEEGTLICRTGCRTDQNCGTGRICNAQTLICQTGCRTDSECGTGEICEDLQCAPGCRENNQCPGAQVCDVTLNSCRESVFAALDPYTTGPYTTGGDVPWREITTGDGFTALEGGNLPRNGESWLEVEVTLDTPKVLAFEWTDSTDDSSNNGMLFCRTIDPCNNISTPYEGSFTRENGVITDITWQSFEREYPAGTHTLRWQYRRNNWSSNAEEIGWVKNVRFLGSDAPVSGDYSVTNSQRYDIPDNNSTGVTSPVEVPVNGIVSAVTIDVDITHTYRGDLTLYLVHDGQEVLANNPTGSSANVILNAHAVSGFEGVNANGTWGLRVADTASNDVGHINSWTLNLELE